jgi:Na+/H+ antiporter NhaB
MNPIIRLLTIVCAVMIAFCSVSCRKEVVKQQPASTTSKIVYLEDQLLDLSKKEDAETFAAFLRELLKTHAL